MPVHSVMEEETWKALLNLFKQENPHVGDPVVLSNFSPVSKFAFLSKILEKSLSSEIIERIQDTWITIVFLKNSSQVVVHTTAQRQPSSRSEMTKCVLLILGPVQFSQTYTMDHGILSQLS